MREKYEDNDFLNGYIIIGGVKAFIGKMKE
jgi:hypothetical protein